MRIGRLLARRNSKKYAADARYAACVEAAIMAAGFRKVLADIAHAERRAAVRRPRRAS